MEVVAMQSRSLQHPAITWLAAAALASGILLVSGLVAAVADEQTPLKPLSLTKYIDPLPVPGAMPMAGPNYYEIGAWQTEQRLHSQLPLTPVYGYGTSQATASYPGATIVAQKGVPISIQWTNHLPATHLLEAAIDPTIPRAHTTTGVPITTHVHGAEVEPESDGGPMTWFTAGFAEKGHDWKKQVLHYANDQLAATIWYHDHAFGYTRHNVYAGLAGFYVITDPGHEPAGLPSGPYDIGLAIQDRMFTTDGKLWYPNVGETPERPVWIPEFFGNVILVNGKVWPYLNVEPRKYRFRILEGSNARFYSLALADRVTGARGPAFHQIASDGGYLATPVVLNDPRRTTSPRLVMAPGERAEVIIDFSAYAPGTEFILKNTAKAPFPSGVSPDPQTVGQIMLFRVVPLTGPDLSVIPQTLTAVTRLGDPTVTRVMTLNEEMGEEGPVGAFLNGMPFHDAAATERPVLGTTEMWEIVNMTGDTHPIHLHLVQFQLLNRQKINPRKYEEAFEQANPEIPSDTYVPVSPAPYLKGGTIAADPNERGWKDTFRMNPGQVTRILVRFAPQDESPAYAFDATAEPGYVWHCHILEHEENDMMRPYYLQSPAQAEASGAAAPVDDPPVLTLARVELEQSRPNPAAGPLEIGFSLPRPAWTEVRVYDLQGREVRVLAAREFASGRNSVTWDRRDASGRQVPKGIYLYRLQSGPAILTRRAVVL
jgi:FtsP/CotA-like multicopper oxidase with cupredoxin domain